MKQNYVYTYKTSSFINLNATQNSHKKYKRFINSKLSNWPKSDQISDFVSYYDGYSKKIPLQNFIIMILVACYKANLEKTKKKTAKENP